MEMMKLFMAARNVSVPLVVVRTADQAATVQAIRAACKVEDKEFPAIQWDAVRGLSHANKAGEAALAALKRDPDGGVDFTADMVAVKGLGKGSVVCVHNAQRQLLASEPGAAAGAVQAVANLRDVLKKDFRMLVLMGPHFALPPELEQDVVVLDHELPGADELAETVRELFASAKLPKPQPDVVAKAVDAVSGLSRFSAEQVIAMSFTENDLDLDRLWDRKRVTIEQTRGLRVWRGTERFKDVVGLDSIKARLLRRLKAKTPVGVVVFLDEIDKVMANVEHDTSGVRMDQLRTLLTEMEDNRWHGCIALGVPGAGKTMLAKAFGNEAGVPTIALDLADMEGSLVGQSEQQLRQAMAVIKAVGRGNAFFIATSNNASVMRPELQRRFTKGTFFFDLLTLAERESVWQFYLQKYGLDRGQARPGDDGWTAAEIRNCCEEAWDTGVSLAEAAEHVVPMATSRADEIDRLRQHAHGRYLDATKPGRYAYQQEKQEEMLRGISLPQAVVVRDPVKVKGES